MIMTVDWNSVVFFAPFVALAASLVALLLAVIMHVKVSRIFRSANAPDIERLLKLHTKTLEDLIRFQADSTTYMKSLSNRIKSKVGTIPTLRFNPFKGTDLGGNQSFSSVFVDEEGNGVVITSMHTRERTSVFAKPLQNWKSIYELTAEEKTVIKQSKTNDSEK